MHNENGIAYQLQIANVENEEILSAEFDYSSSEIIDDNEYIINLHLIPKQSGKTNLTITFNDGETEEVINTYNYFIKADENLNVSFKVIK